MNRDRKFKEERDLEKRVRECPYVSLQMEAMQFHSGLRSKGWHMRAASIETIRKFFDSTYR